MITKLRRWATFGCHRAFTRHPRDLPVTTEHFFLISSNLLFFEIYIFHTSQKLMGNVDHNVGDQHCPSISKSQIWIKDFQNTSVVTGSTHTCQIFWPIWKILSELRDLVITTLDDLRWKVSVFWQYLVRSVYLEPPPIWSALNTPLLIPPPLGFKFRFSDFMC